MFELTTGADALGLQSVAEMTQLNRRHRHGGVSVRKNVCLITLNGSLTKSPTNFIISTGGTGSP